MSNKITVNGVEYIRADSVDQGDIKIVVLDRGFVYVGNVQIEDGFVVIRNAFNIRVWGTTKGLGQLCSGPTPQTQLDKIGTIHAPIRALISLVDVEQEAWKTIVTLDGCNGA